MLFRGFLLFEVTTKCFYVITFDTMLPLWNDGMASLQIPPKVHCTALCPGQLDHFQCLTCCTNLATGCKFNLYESFRKKRHNK